MSRAAPDSTTSGTVPEDDSHDVDDESKQPPDVKGCMHLSVAPVRDRRANAFIWRTTCAWVGCSAKKLEVEPADTVSENDMVGTTCKGCNRLHLAPCPGVLWPGDL